MQKDLKVDSKESDELEVLSILKGVKGSLDLYLAQKNRIRLNHY